MCVDWWVMAVADQMPVETVSKLKAVLCLLAGRYSRAGRVPGGPGSDGGCPR